jgi:eukaryotic-like serine/threonine-protein kinase
MQSDKWQEIKRCLQEALDLPLEEHSAYLSAVPDEDIRRSVEVLLAVSSTRAEVLEHLHFTPHRPEMPLFKTGDPVATYTIIREIAIGGMGSVYLARDEKNDREIALKILAPHTVRFSANEHKILARLSHKNIARLYESGITETGFRFLAMEYVDGPSITTFCDEHRLTLRGRLELFRKVCSAVSYAHRHTIIHRDLKPENILVDAEGEPKLLDFGIAKLLRPDAELTRTGERPVSLAFASPEQLDGEHTGTPTDTYSLGVLLSLLLSGRLPYLVKSIYDLPEVIQKHEPERPSTLVSLPEEEHQKQVLPRASIPEEGDIGKLKRHLEGDLDAIVLRALRKEPESRYRSVDELSDDIGRYLKNEPVSARNGTRRYRALKFVKRHRYAVSFGTVGALVLFGFVIALALLQRESAIERDRARKEARRASAVSDFLVDMFRVSNPSLGRDQVVTAREVLDGALLKLVRVPPREPETRGTLLYSLGKIHLNLGMYAPAETLLEPSLRDLRLDPVQNRRRIAETLTDLATLRYFDGRYREAETNASEALSIETAHSDSGMRMTVLSLMAHIAFSRGDLPKAESLFREVARTREREAESDNLLLAQSLNDLACSLHAQGKYNEASALYTRALGIRMRHLGPRSPEVLESMHNVACLTRDQGKLAAAYEELVKVRMGYRALAALNSPTLPTLFHNMGAAAITRKELESAEIHLSDALEEERRLLPDDHPNIAKTLGEFGRLEHARGHSREAEHFYRDSLLRLDRALGKNHPDRQIVANNLAVLLTETNRARDAESLWRDILQKEALHTLRSDIARAIQGNVALSRQSDHARVPYQTVPLEMLALSTPTEYHGEPVPAPLQTEEPSRGIVRFSDSFDAGVIDARKWETGGSSVRESGGTLVLSASVVDHTGWARTLPIPIDPSRPLVISRRVRLHPGNEFFDGLMSITPTGYPEKRFGVSYASYHYTGGGECVAVGFSLFRRDANSHRFADRRANASPLIPPAWDRWLDEKLVYDPRTGEARYFLDGREQLVYNVGALPPTTTSLTLTFTAWGWYTGHLQEMDSLEARQ